MYVVLCEFCSIFSSLGMYQPIWLCYCWGDRVVAVDSPIEKREGDCYKIVGSFDTKQIVEIRDTLRNKLVVEGTKEVIGKFIDSMQK